jgi:hypothetical protein
MVYVATIVKVLGFCSEGCEVVLAMSLNFLLLLQLSELSSMAYDSRRLIKNDFTSRQLFFFSATLHQLLYY